MVVEKMYGTKENIRADYLLLMEQMTVREILALQLAVGTSVMARGPVEVARFLFNEDHPLQLLTEIATTE